MRNMMTAGFDFLPTEKSKKKLGTNRTKTEDGRINTKIRRLSESRKNAKNDSEVEGAII